MDYKKAGVDIEAGYKSVEQEDDAKRSADQHWWIFRSIFIKHDKGYGRAGFVIRNRRLWNESKACDGDG